MSTTEQEREIEVVAGTIEGVIQKKPDTWQVAVKSDGSQYDKKLWTKDAELVQSLTAKLGQHGAFVCGASYWTNQSGTQVRSLWINGEADGNAAERVVTPVSAEAGSGPRTEFDKPFKAAEGMSKEEWARKDSAIHKMACIKTAADALKHTIPADPRPEDLTKFLGRVTTLTLAWHRSVLAERDDPTGEDVPFG